MSASPISSPSSRRRVPSLMVAVALAGPTLVLTGTAAAAPSPATSSTPVMVVLDSSGSMNSSDAPGPRIDAAKGAVRGLVRALPADAQVGLEVYGTSTGSSPAEKGAGCRDITVPVAVGPVDPAKFTASVDGVQARGYTPIGQSLLTAAQNLPQQGPRSIVLVSDGEDTCAPPPPCDVAQQLKAKGVDLVVHTIGFKVDQAAREQLTCIAGATGGSYRDAADGPALGSVLQNRSPGRCGPTHSPAARSPAPRPRPAPPDWCRASTWTAWRTRAPHRGTTSRASGTPSRYARGTRPTSPRRWCRTRGKPRVPTHCSCIRRSTTVVPRAPPPLAPSASTGRPSRCRARP